MSAASRPGKTDITKIPPPGAVRIEPHREPGWYLVRIGRDRGEKRFNITRNEAAELVRVLTSDVLTPAELGR